MEQTLDKILLSVIVPIYNVEPYLEQCVQSILNQTYTHLEIILVNDGSPDGSKQICNKFKSKDSRINVINKPNGGLVSARKAGILAATGDYIGFVDGDDWIEPEMFQSLMIHAIDSDADIVAAGHKEELNGEVVEVLKNAIPIGYYPKSKLIEEVYPKMICTGVFSQFGVFSYLWNKVFKKSVILNNQLTVDDRIFMAEDAACTYPTLLDANSLFITDSAHYRYRQRVDSMVKSRQVDNAELLRYNLLYKHLANKFRNSECYQDLMSQLDLFLLSLLTVRSSLDFSDNEKYNELFAFKEIPINSRVAIFGAGTFGQHLVKMIRNGNNFKLIGWFDKLFALYQKLNLPVQNIHEIKLLSFDYVLVAFIDENHSNKMRDELLELGIEENKIVLVDHFVHHPIPELLKRFGLDL